MIRTTLALALSLMLTAPATADTADCAEIGEIAGNVMRLRQVEHPISVLLDWAEEDTLMRTIVLEAYSQPGYVTPAAQERAAARFENHVVKECHMAGLTRAQATE